MTGRKYHKVVHSELWMVGLWRIDIFYFVCVSARVQPDEQNP